MKRKFRTHLSSISHELYAGAYLEFGNSKLLSYSEFELEDEFRGIIPLEISLFISTTLHTTNRFD